MPLLEHLDGSGFFVELQSKPEFPTGLKLKQTVSYTMKLQL